VEVSDDEWLEAMAVDLTSTFNSCRAVFPGMMAKEWGPIINVASIAEMESTPNFAAYSASKAAVSASTKSLGKELARTGVARERRRTSGHRVADGRRNRA
jgi:NAD(P)-dependent dehydrogenase (short-subunit alcohol dehydrogenase family)